MNNFKHKMRGKNPAVIVGWVILGILGITALAILFGFVLMWLWNALMPEIFGLQAITYWQAVGLFVLSKLLFGGFGGGSGKKHQHKNHGKCSSRHVNNDFSKWELYDKFWQEEGEVAYENYKKRTNGSDSTEA
ncbi:MAG: hypothetical protein WC044_02385 [Crocinitomicaceae bacterium]